MIGRQSGAAGAGATTASGPGGSIYDLGYQGYEGPRLGRRSATVALFWNTLRACFGIGRGGRAKIAPFVLAALALLPAVIAVGIAALAAQAGGRFPPHPTIPPPLRPFPRGGGGPPVPF